MCEIFTLSALSTAAASTGAGVGAGLGSGAALGAGLGASFAGGAATATAASAGMGLTGYLALGGLAISAVGTGLSAYGQYQAGKYQEDIAESNARIAELQAAQRLDQAAEEKRKLGLQVAQIRGRGRTAFAAGNVRLGSGSVLDWDADLTETAVLDYDTIDYNAALDVWGMENQAANLRAEGGLARRRGAFGAVGTGIAGTGNLLTQGALTRKTFR